MEATTNQATTNQAKSTRETEQTKKGLEELVAGILPTGKLKAFCSSSELGGLAVDGILCIAEDVDREGGKLLYLTLDPPEAVDAIALQFQLWEVMGEYLPVYIHSLHPSPAPMDYRGLLDGRIYAKTCRLFQDTLRTPWLPLGRACMGLFLLREARKPDFPQRWANFVDMMSDIHRMKEGDGRTAMVLVHAGLCRKAISGTKDKRPL
jgi:hypothetical protein